MYDPVKDGVEKSVESVVYVEAPPPVTLREIVHCVWELRTEVDFDGKVPLLCEFVEGLVDAGVVVPNPVTAAILANLDRIHSVADMAAVAALSPRQLQRTLKATTGLTPHDLSKVLRLQHSFRHDCRWWFADQSHFTHSCRAMTGYTPGRFGSTFDV